MNRMLNRIAVFALITGECLSLTAQVEPGAGSWKTWVLSSGQELRLPAPPESNAEELDWLKSFMAETKGSADATRQMRYWNGGPPAYRWVEIMLSQIETRGLTNPKNARAMVLFNVAMYDATVAAWDSKYAWNRKRPAEADPSLRSEMETPRSPSYPSEHAVTAGAASEILAYLFPSDAEVFRGLADQAGRASLTAGINYPSDVTSGLQLGRAVGAKVVTLAQNDGSQAVWSGTVPTGPGMWVGATPLEPLAGTWKTWVLSSGSQLRPGPPLAYDSTAKRIELDDVKNFQRAFLNTQKAFYYQSLEGIFNVFYDLLAKRMLESDLSRNPPRAARAYALAAIAHNDGSVACWDAKYTYWAARPNQLDPSITTLFPQPGHPSYPAAHGCFSGAIARVIGGLFPDFRDVMDAKASEAAESRFWAAIHFRSDLDAGLAIGRKLGDLILERAAADGSNRSDH